MTDQHLDSSYFGAKISPKNCQKKFKSGETFNALVSLNVRYRGDADVAPPFRQKIFQRWKRLQKHNVASTEATPIGQARRRLQMSSLLIPSNFMIQTESGDESSLNFNASGDLILKNPARLSSGSESRCRALTIGFPAVGATDKLIINFQNDFSSGVRIDGQVQLNNLQSPPAGVATDRVVADADGNLYKQD